ncbi:zinc finger A20 and AN1 domain-containing stress-associated protein 6-like [Iris pallida]|uniref:Zinc finger A20 and AN1 domain-containing stress-associated protein 6-like n=1 Tax=Iris pallida TaxID=29817 RepID=A0AAX6FLY5_IRIPA|nr:zinc finger A20 and AN1 domain-containing stress-associated protein 6-like [Iris pallida]KAJ6817005.1 zinc finger A20 and AN1 domain-containing stress-associated protein 6-like [Iris pallida]
MAEDNWKNDINETECQKRDGPVLCANNCGFFGSAITNNFCSKCYRDLAMKQQLEASPVVPVAEKLPSNASSSVIMEPIKEELEKLDETLVEIAVKKKLPEVCSKPMVNRCVLCCKKVGLTGFKCRCGGTFCSSHRYSETHECSFDYKTAGREAIAKENPIVKAEKIEKI